MTVHAGGVHRARQPDERARAATGTPRPGGPSASRCRGRGRSWSSRRTGTSTPPRSPPCRGRARSTTSTGSRRSCSTSSTRRPGCPSWPSEVADVVQADLGRAPTSTAGASTTAPGRCSCTRSPTPTSPSCSCRSTRSSPSTTTSSSAPRSRRCATRRAGRSAAATSCTTSAASTGPAGRRLRLGAALRRARPRSVMLTDPAEVARLDGHRDFDLAVPTPDHFLPAAVPRRARRGDERAGRGAGRRLRLRLAVDDGLHGRHGPAAATGSGVAAALPDGPPADGANI